jgi:hypothetical protein
VKPQQVRTADLGRQVEDVGVDVGLDAQVCVARLHGIKPGVECRPPALAPHHQALVVQDGRRCTALLTTISNSLMMCTQLHSSRPISCISADEPYPQMSSLANCSFENSMLQHASYTLYN